MQSAHLSRRMDDNSLHRSPPSLTSSRSSSNPFKLFGKKIIVIIVSTVVSIIASQVNKFQHEFRFLTKMIGVIVMKLLYSDGFCLVSFWHNLSGKPWGRWSHSFLLVWDVSINKVITERPEKLLTVCTLSTQLPTQNNDTVNTTKIADQNNNNVSD